MIKNILIFSFSFVFAVTAHQKAMVWEWPYSINYHYYYSKLYHLIHLFTFYFYQAFQITDLNCLCLFQIYLSLLIEVYFFWTFQHFMDWSWLLTDSAHQQSNFMYYPLHLLII